MIEVAKKVGANTPMVWPKKKSRVGMLEREFKI